MDIQNHTFWNVSSFFIRGFIMKPCLSISSLGRIGSWEHDIEASKVQGRARGRKGERKKILYYDNLDLYMLLLVHFCIYVFACLWDPMRLYSFVQGWLNPFWNLSSTNPLSSVLWEKPSLTERVSGARPALSQSRAFKRINPLQNQRPAPLS